MDHLNHAFELFGQSVKDIEHLRLLMRKYNALASGSTVLHFFLNNQTKSTNVERPTWIPSDLDIYIEKRSLGRTGLLDWHTYLTESEEMQLASNNKNEEQYDNVWEVYSYKNSTDRTAVQLIIVIPSPIKFILSSFYGTHVMNIATWHAAYCLFPNLTLQENKMCLFSMRNHKELLSYDKYVLRGFNPLPLENAKCLFQEVCASRTVGDQFTQKLEFSSITRHGVTLQPQCSPWVDECEFGINNIKLKLRRWSLEATNTNTNAATHNSTSLEDVET